MMRFMAPLFLHLSKMYCSQIFFRLCSGLNCVPPESLCWSSYHAYLQMWLFGDQAFIDVIKAKQSHMGVPQTSMAKGLTETRSGYTADAVRTARTQWEGRNPQTVERGLKRNKAWASLSQSRKTAESGSPDLFLHPETEQAKIPKAFIRTPGTSEEIPVPRAKAKQREVLLKGMKEKKKKKLLHFTQESKRVLTLSWHSSELLEETCNWWLVPQEGKGRAGSGPTFQLFWDWRDGPRGPVEGAWRQLANGWPPTSGAPVLRAGAWNRAKYCCAVDTRLRDSMNSWKNNREPKWWTINRSLQKPHTPGRVWETPWNLYPSWLLKIFPYRKTVCKGWAWVDSFFFFFFQMTNPGVGGGESCGKEQKVNQ